MRIVGVDPGKEGAIAVVNIHTATVLDYCYFHESSSKGFEAQTNVMLAMHEALKKMEYDRLAIEEPIYKMNKKTYAYQCFGVGFLLGLGHKAPLFINPSSVKKLVGGKSKDQHVIPYVHHHCTLDYEITQGIDAIIRNKQRSPTIPKYGIRALADAIAIALTAGKELNENAR